MGLAFVVAACRQPSAQTPPSIPDAGPPQPHAALVTDAAVDAPSIADPVREAYAAIREGRFADARRLLEKHDDAGSRCWGSVRASVLPNGGMRVAAPRGLVVTNPAGEIVHHEVVTGCLRRADESLRITSTDGAIRIVESTGTADLTYEDTGDPLAQLVFVSSSWALAVDAGGEYVALNRADGHVLRGRHGADPSLASHWMRPVGAALAGDRVVVDRGTQIVLLRADGQSVDVRGCKGKLLAAQSTETGERALHVTSTMDVESTDTRVCLVKDDGTTRKIVPLGSATCGLARAMPCPYALQASTRRLLGFGSMRGGFVLVDVVAGRLVTVPLPPGAYPDGLSPGGFSSCGGGELCISYTSSANGDNGMSAVRMNGAKLTTRVRTKEADPDDAWCELAGLPVPKAVCAAE